MCVCVCKHFVCARVFVVPRDIYKNVITQPKLSKICKCNSMRMRTRLRANGGDGGLVSMCVDIVINVFLYVCACVFFLS